MGITLSTTFLGKSLPNLVGYHSSLFSVESSNKPESLADYVRRVRQEKRFSTTEVERQSGGDISDAYVTRIENGYVRNVSPEKLRALAKGLQVSEDEIFAVVRGKSAEGDLTLTELRLIEYFRQLPPERQPDALALLETLRHIHGAETLDKITPGRQPTKQEQSKKRKGHKA
ncbi:MAG: helix-turn-helix transcriptional regulator [Pyrinomonadaceae bacterium]